MRYLLFVALFISTICQAVGPEDMWYVAIDSKGFETPIIMQSEEKIELDGRTRFRPIYGAQQGKEFAYCWSNKTDFLCSPAPGSSPEVKYIHGPDTGVTFKKAMAIFKRGDSFKKNLVFSGYLVCDTGCKGLPEFIFVVSVYEP